MRKGLTDELGKFIEGKGKKNPTLHNGCSCGFDKSAKMGSNGFYFDTNTVKGWFLSKKEAISEGKEFKPPEILSFFYAQKKYVSYLVKEEIFKHFSDFFSDDFEIVWQEFVESMNFIVLEEDKFQKASRNIDYDPEHCRTCKENKFILITKDEILKDSCKPAYTDVGLLKKIQDMD